MESSKLALARTMGVPLFFDYDLITSIVRVNRAAREGERGGGRQVRETVAPSTACTLPFFIIISPHVLLFLPLFFYTFIRNKTQPSCAQGNCRGRDRESPLIL